MVPQKLLDAITEHNSFLLISHISPDGDTVGSAAALAGILLSLGKRCFWRCQDDIPDNMAAFDFIAPLKQLQPCSYDAVIAVDCADRNRMGNTLQYFDACKTKLVIDHHKTNNLYGDVNYVEDYPATAQLVCHVAKALNVKYNKQIASALYLAFISDTGRFTYRGVTSETMSLAAQLLDAEIDCNYINRIMFEMKTVAQNMLIAKALTNMRLSCNGLIATTVLTYDEILQCDGKPGDTEGIVQYLLNTAGVKVCAFMRQTEDESIKVSMRSTSPEYDVAAIAAELGGGGHTLAAGCTLQCDCREAELTIIKALERCLEDSGA